MREVAVDKSSSITQRAGTGDEMISIVRVVIFAGSVHTSVKSDVASSTY